MANSSPVHIPTVINAGLSAALLIVFAYINRDRSRVIKGTALGPALPKPSGQQSS
jgi:hypothetical protein